MVSSSKRKTRIKEGSILIDIDVIDDWNVILHNANTGKNGQPYIYPLPLMILIYQLRHYHRLSFREIEKIMGEMSRYISGVEKPDYSTICKRIKTIDTAPIYDDKNILVKKPKGITLIVGPSKIEAFNSKDWKVYLWKAKKVYRKVFFKLNDKGKIFFIEIS